MAAKLTILTHKIAIQLHLVQRAVPFVVLAQGSQSGNFWIHTRICPSIQSQIVTVYHSDVTV
jgi:hypothetical protein